MSNACPDCHRRDLNKGRTKGVVSCQFCGLVWRHQESQLSRRAFVMRTLEQIGVGVISTVGEELLVKKLVTQKSAPPAITGTGASTATASTHAIARVNSTHLRMTTQRASVIVLNPAPPARKEDQPIIGLRRQPISVRRELWSRRTQPRRINTVVLNRARWTKLRYPKALDTPV